MEFCRSCDVCQHVGKPNQKIPSAPLIPIPAFEEPFSRVIIDCVGPLPKTKSGNQYLLTIMCASTRFPEAIPLRNIKAPTIVKSLIKFFTLVGLPRSLQSDQGSNFMSGLMQQVMFQLGIKQFKSTAYHPESQGALERFHQTLKNMLRAYCIEQGKDWDEGVHLVLFASREAVQESLGFSPFELLFGRTVRGPLKVLKEVWLQDEPVMNLLDYVSDMRQRAHEAWEVARKNLKQAQTKMKTWHDKKAKNRQFKVGEKVEVIMTFPAPATKKELMRFLGMTGYYRKFCKNFSSVVAPLTDLLKKEKKYVWDDRCEKAFTKIKTLLLTAPVLVTPDYQKPFKMHVDASDYGAGAVLLQESEQKIDHPISYFSQKFDRHQRNYSTCEKETLALILALRHFDFYLSAARFPIEVFTDHNPLVFLNKMRQKSEIT